MLNEKDLKEIVERHEYRIEICKGGGLTPEQAFGPTSARAHEDIDALTRDNEALRVQLTSVQTTNETLARDLETASRALAGPGRLKGTVVFEPVLTREEGAQVDAFIGAIRATEEAATAVEPTGDEDTLLTPVRGGHVFAGTWEQFVQLERVKATPCIACGAPIQGRGGPCPGWPRTGAGDALRRLVRAIVREAPDDKPNGPQELAVLRFSGDPSKTPSRSSTPPSRSAGARWGSPQRPRSWPTSSGRVSARSRRSPSRGETSCGSARKAAVAR